MKKVSLTIILLSISVLSFAQQQQRDPNAPLKQYPIAEKPDTFAQKVSILHWNKRHTNYAVDSMVTLITQHFRVVEQFAAKPNDTSTVQEGAIFFLDRKNKPLDIIEEDIISMVKIPK